MKARRTRPKAGKAKQQQKLLEMQVEQLQIEVQIDNFTDSILTKEAGGGLRCQTYQRL
jgi:hypothetical protein